MRYDIDLRDSRKRGGRSLAVTKERMVRIVTSTPLILLLVIVVLIGIGYLAVYVPFFQHPPGHRNQLQELRLQEKRLEAQREALLREAGAAFQIMDLAAAWASRLPAFGEHLPEGLWLTRIALHEDQPQRGRQPRGTPRTAEDSVAKYMAIEGRVDTRRHPSPLEPISSYLTKLRRDRRIKQVLASLHLVSSRATKEDPALVEFELRGELALDNQRMGAEERIQAWRKAHATGRQEGS